MLLHFLQVQSPWAGMLGGCRHAHDRLPGRLTRPTRPACCACCALQGYGLTLGTINALAVTTSIFQALPSLGLQVVSIIIWMVARFFMYSR